MDEDIYLFIYLCGKYLYNQMQFSTIHVDIGPTLHKVDTIK